MKVAILDDYFDMLRTRPCLPRLQVTTHGLERLRPGHRPARHAPVLR